MPTHFSARTRRPSSSSPRHEPRRGAGGRKPPRRRGRGGRGGRGSWRRKPFLAPLKLCVLCASAVRLRKRGETLTRPPSGASLKCVGMVVTSCLAASSEALQCSSHPFETLSRALKSSRGPSRPLFRALQCLVATQKRPRAALECPDACHAGFLPSLECSSASGVAPSPSLSASLRRGRPPFGPLSDGVSARASSSYQRR